MVVAIVIAIFALSIALSSDRPVAGSSVNGGNVTDYTAVNTDNGYWVGGVTQLFNGSGVITLATTTIAANYYTIGGIDYASVQVSMAATSSVPCSIPNPFGAATTTLLSHIVQVTANGIASAQTLDVSTSTTAFASSSPAFVKKYAAGIGNFTSFWTPGLSTSTVVGVLGNDATYLVGDSPFVIAPSEFVNTRIATGTPGTYAAYYTGTCSATFMKP